MNKSEFTLRVFLIKLFSWEYWPMWVVYLPVSFYYLFLSIKARSLFFFSGSNPSIETGGMFFESKWKIFELIPKDYFPKTILVDVFDDFKTVLGAMEQSEIIFPVVAKPDRGERGWAVKILNTQEELADYREKVKVPFLIQSYVNLPLELSVFYYRHPSAENGMITSVTFKKLLTITGDGKSELIELIKSDSRAFLQLNKLLLNEKLNKNMVLKKGEEMILVPYGNHVRGAMFLDYNHIIDERLTSTFNTISKRINGFYFGRFDLRCSSIEDLKAGKNFSILELNGAGAEPAHIYQPGFSFFEAQKVLAQHYKMMYAAAVANKNSGVRFMDYNSYKTWKQEEKIYKSKIVLS